MYYIYEIWDTKSNQPIYVGYAKGHPDNKYKRYESHLKEALAVSSGSRKPTKKMNMYKINVLIQCQHHVEYKFPYTNLSYSDACEKESELIEQYGRRILDQGPLTNLDSGGRGGMTRTPETCQKISLALTGRTSPLKGKQVGPYSEDRVSAAVDGYKRALAGPDGGKIRQRISEANQGKVLSEIHKQKISESLKGRPSPMKGKASWNKGLTKETDQRVSDYSKKVSRSCSGRPAWNKGKPSPEKGKTYEERYGPEKARQMKEARRQTAWVNNGTDNKKIKQDQLDQFIETGWVRGRIMPRKTQ
jgi:hypothetical protein